MPAPGNPLAAEAAAWRAARQAESERDYGSAYVGTGRPHAYEGAGRHGTWFKNWPAHLQSADRDWIPSRAPVTARTRDLFRNSPIAPAAVARRKNAAVGKGWRLSSKPKAKALGMTPDQARDLAELIETEWHLYAYGYNFSVDAERKLNFGQLLRVAASHLMLDGEYLALVEWAEDEPTKYKTRLRLVDPDRLSNPIGRMEGQVLPSGGEMRGGVETNANGAPVRYWIRARHPVDLGISANTFNWEPWERYATPLGRPQVLHGFDPDRAGQTRGVSRFAATLKSFRGFDRFTDATIQSAAINALILGYVQSSAGPEAVSEYFKPEDLATFEAERESFYKDNPVELGDAVFPAIPLGDELKLATASKDVTSFDSFTRSIIRLIAASLGVTYEEVSMDYSSTNYSSARAAMIHAWAETVAFMGVLEAQLVKPFFVAWLEEAFDIGAIVPANDNAPSFYDATDAYAEGRWLGPGRGYIDPTKEILAAAARIEAGVSTLEDECADQGKDYREIMEQTAFEQSERRRLGIQPAGVAEAQAISDTKNPAKGAQDPTDPAGDPVVAPEDARPGQGSALRQIAAFCDTPGHEASLDARPVAA